MKKFFRFLLLISLTIWGQSFAVREGRYDITQLESNSNIILIGHVTGIEKGKDIYDIASITVISVLKGNVADETLTFSYPARRKEIRSKRAFRLRRDKSGIFFLKSIVDGEATPVFPGSFSFFQIPTYIGS